MAEIVVLVTTADEEEAARIGRILVEKKLAACATLIPKVRSIFHWEGAVSEEQECLMLVKSTSDVFGTLESTVKRNHSYDVPEIIALPILMGSHEYLTWLHEMTHPFG